MTSCCCVVVFFGGGGGREMLRAGGRFLFCLLFAFFSGVFTVFVKAVIASQFVAPFYFMTTVITPQFFFHRCHPVCQR